MNNKQEKVNHPIHYGGEDNPMEVIKIIEHYELGFNLGNTIKYVLRADLKYPTLEGKIEDLKKAVWYLEREIKSLNKSVESLKRLNEKPNE